MGRHPSDATLSRYADGDLGKEEETLLATHLARCSECERRLAEIIHIKDLAESLEPVEVPPGLLAGIRERIAASEASKTSGLWRGIVLGFAVSAAILLFILLPHSTTQKHREGPVTPLEPVTPLVPVTPLEPVTPLVIEPAGEPVVPPLGLAHAQGFYQTSDASGSDAILAAYEKPSQDSTSKVILIPLDEKARQNMAASRRGLPPFGEDLPRCNGNQGFIITVGERSYR
ncbi:MAG: zf-HC2 domain-containing protein [candidate division WOR-3 bacterium]|nr:zf-HC2 domain-containing protein [candidate division WOR-3 bacterium]